MLGDYGRHIPGLALCANLSIDKREDWTLSRIFRYLKDLESKRPSTAPPFQWRSLCDFALSEQGVFCYKTTDAFIDDGFLYDATRCKIDVVRVEESNVNYL